eukprot:CAMPEP_0174723664 /NCGR_PEP_ID=MMETSP1094-20130205/41569_1 /TAXON_ID=156173 /ORGANISM="Chrysochromulina brevifilum, Strain UTEX LB 985" /LENGTH=224 /DNA_ID=CAMNT_0015924749 /DNA_START=18 /DNA_END=692 /DNA_ORIENTATION=+
MEAVSPDTRVQPAVTLLHLAPAAAPAAESELGIITNLVALSFRLMGSDPPAVQRPEEDVGLIQALSSRIFGTPVSSPEKSLPPTIAEEAMQTATAPAPAATVAAVAPAPAPVTPAPKPEPMPTTSPPAPNPVVGAGVINEEAVQVSAPREDDAARDVRQQLQLSPPDHSIGGEAGPLSRRGSMSARRLSAIPMNSARKLYRGAVSTMHDTVDFIIEEIDGTARS